MHQFDEIPTRFATQSYFLRTNLHQEFVSYLKKSLPQQAFDTCEHIALVLLKPDAVCADKHFPILERLMENGYNILYGDFIQDPKERMFEELYQYNLTLRNEQNQIASWWINRRLYTTGPSILLLVSHNRMRDVDLYADLIRMKGPSDPFKTIPGQIRCDFGGCNMAMNLIHCSDDPVSSLREFLIFRPMQVLDATLRQIYPLLDSSTGLQARNEEVIKYLKQINPAIVPSRADIDFISVLWRLRQRSALAVSALCSPGEPCSFLWPGAVPSEPVPGARLMEALDRSRSYLDRLQSTKFERADWRLDIGLKLIERLCQFDEITDRDVPDLVKMLSALGVRTDAWDELVLETSAHYSASMRQYLQSQQGELA